MAENGVMSLSEEERTEKYDYDLFTIGIGSGGTRASRVAAQLGAKVAAVELPFNPISSNTEGGVGGTCVLRGCVPKKILMYGSAFSAEFKDSEAFGWSFPAPPRFDWHTLVANKTKEIQRLNGVYKKILTAAKVELLEGAGKVVGPHAVEVDFLNGERRRVTAKYILVATGGRATRLDIPGKELTITSDEALCLPELPKSIIVIGGGYIAVEFAGIFNGLGSEVDLVFRGDKPLRGFDEELRDVVTDNLNRRGINLRKGLNATKIEKVAGDRMAVTFDSGEVKEVDAVMMATGRAANTASLGLEALGVELQKGGSIKVNEYSQSTVPSIWAVGDVTDRINLTPVALHEGTCFANTLFANNPQKPDHMNIASAVFCQPPLATVGLAEHEAVEVAEGDVVVFTASFTPMKFAISGRQEKTFIKILVDSATDRVLGVGMVGPDSAEIMQTVAVAMKCGVTKKQFDATIGIHPTTAEELVTMRTPTRRVPRGAKAYGQK